MEKVRLSRKTTVARYRLMETARDRMGIAQFLRERFTERFFRPLESMTAPHGFLIMAISCLLIESIQAFRNGWQGVTEQRKKPYRKFFRDHPSFGVAPSGLTACTITSVPVFSIWAKPTAGGEFSDVDRCWTLRFEQSMPISSLQRSKIALRSTARNSNGLPGARKSGPSSATA